MGLLDQLQAYIEANTPRSTRPVAKPSTVINQGLLNPNKFNAPAANRFKDSAFGLLGVVPGLGDASSVAESADLFNRGENFAGTMAAVGALPFIPAMAGMVKRSGDVADALGDAAKVARQPTQYELAHQVAQKNAVDMLGLPPNNTAMDRARAMGFDTPAWRGSDADEVVSRRAPYGAMGAAHYSGDDPIIAAGYAGEETGANVLPLLLSGKYADNKTWSDLVNKAGWDGAEKAAKDSGLSGVHDSMFEDAFATFEPKNIRSRFAAFDPAKRNSSDLLAGLAPYIGVGGLLSLGLMAPEQAQANQ